MPNFIEKIVKDVLLKDTKMLSTWIVRYDNEERFKHLYASPENGSPKEGDIIVIYRRSE